MRTLEVRDLGRIAYSESLALQRDLVQKRKAAQIPDQLLIVEHPHVITLGRNGNMSNLLASEEILGRAGIEFHPTDRGGDITYHGPGQLVGYPIIDLKRHRRDLHWYLRRVEEALIRALEAFGIVAERSPGYTGVWTLGRKIASIGVHARDWVTWHGFALNVNTDLGYFDLIVPCGIEAVTMTSIARELGSDEPSMREVENVVTRAFGDVFELMPRPVGPLASREWDAGGRSAGSPDPAPIDGY